MTFAKKALSIGMLSSLGLAGAAFAQVEAVLLIARLFRRFDFHVEAPETVRPAARLTTRPARQVFCRVGVHR